jgi:putative DNA primase/helicase
MYGQWGNWKWTIVDVLTHVIWKENVVWVWLHEIAKEQNILLLLGKLVSFDADMHSSTQLDSGTVKKLISWELVVGKKVYQPPICFSNYAKLILCTNTLPHLNNIDKSITRRFVMLHLKKSFTDNPDVELKKKLKSEAQMIFSRAIVWLKRLVKRGRFNVPLCLKNTVEEYVKESDSVAMFLDEWELETWPDLFISNSAIYNVYKCYCEMNGYRPLGMRRLVDRLVTKWFQRHRTSQARWVKGIGHEDFTDYVSQL